MKQKLSLIPLSIVFLSLVCCSRVDTERTGLVKITDRVYAFIASGPTADEGMGANCGFVVGDRGVLVVDSRYTPALAREFLTELRSVTDAPLLYLVNTHYHPDHTWGNSVFKKEGATIISRIETRENMERYSPTYLEYYRTYDREAYEKLKEVTIVLPDTTFGDELALDLGGVEVVLRYFGPAHTAGDCIVTVPAERVAFAGGILSKGYHPILGDMGADLENWLSTLDRLEGMKFRFIVPGQGYVCSPSEIAVQSNYIVELKQLCIEEIGRGTPMESAAKSIVIPGTEDYLQPNILPFNVQAFYRREVLNVVKPDFGLELPEGMNVVDGGGGTDRGSIQWYGPAEKGTLEITVKWWETPRREIILQDIHDQVGRDLAAQKSLQIEIEGSKKLDLGGEESAAVYGRRSFTGEGWVKETGAWTRGMTLRNGKIYMVDLFTNTNADRKAEKENMKQLEELVKTLRFKPR